MCVYSLFTLFTVIVFNMNLSRIMCVTKQCSRPNFHAWLMMAWRYRKSVCVCARVHARVCVHVSMIHFNITSLAYALFCQLISSCEIPKPKCYVSFFPMCATWPAHCILHALTIHSTWWRVEIAKLHSKWMGTQWQTVTYLYTIMPSVTCTFTRKGDNTLSLWFKLLKGSTYLKITCQMEVVTA